MKATSFSGKQRLLEQILLLLMCCTNFCSVASTETSRITNNEDDTHSHRALNQFEPETRIINGVEATPMRYPYIASLHFDGSHYCGGAVIAPDIVLSAAHCYNASEVDAVVVVGQYDHTQDWEDHIIEKKGEILHPQYDGEEEGTMDNDFSIIVLKEKIREEDGIQIVRLNSDNAVPVVGAATTVMGWGDVDPSANEIEVPDVLMETEVFVQSNEECENSSGYYYLTDDEEVFEDLEGQITDNMLCAWAEDTDACQGDSGGPLVLKGETSDQDVLVGVVSWAFGCAEPEFPGVYARVSAQYKWIREQVCGLSDEPPAYMECTEETKFSEGFSFQPTATTNVDETTTYIPTFSPLPIPTYFPTQSDESNSGIVRVSLIHLFGSGAALILLFV